MKGCFYLFRLPAVWRRYFVMNTKFTAAELGLSGRAERAVYLASTVVPMGWRNAMGLVQYLHRGMLVLGAGSPRCLALPLDREIRKDKPMPVLSAVAAKYMQLWEVYADDLDLMRLLKRLEENMDEITSFHRAASDVYAHWGVPLS